MVALPIMGQNIFKLPTPFGAHNGIWLHDCVVADGTAMARVLVPLNSIPYAQALPLC